MTCTPTERTAQMLPQRVRWALPLALATFVMPVTGHAQAPPPRASDGINVPDKSLVSTDDASATLLNPANLAFMPGVEARFLGVHTGQDAPFVARGYAMDIGIPLWILGTGLRIDWIRPPTAAPAPYAYAGLTNPYQWVRWGAAIRLGQWAALGSTLAWSISDAPVLDDLFSASAGLAIRPSRFVSAAAVLRDYNEPDNDTGFRINRSVDFGMAVRPIDGRQLLELAIETSYRTGADRWVPQVSASVGVPYVGRLRGGVQMLDAENAEVLTSVGLEMNWGALQMTGGALLGTALSRDGTGLYAGGAVRTFHEPHALPLPDTVVRIRIESTPGVRQHTRLLRALWRLADDEDIAGVVFEMRTKPTQSLAYAEELADAMRLLRAKGKKVLCHLEDADGRSLYACAAADRIAINPAGGLRFSGLSARYFYFGGLLDKLGVKADFVRIGDHKLAPEQYALRGASLPGRQDHEALLRAVESVYLRGIARGRPLDVDTARTRINGGPYIATEARDAGLIDELVYEDEIDRFVQETFGHPVLIEDLDLPDRRRPYWGDPPKIAVVYLHGNMVDGESMYIPILDIRMAGSYTVAKALRQAREDMTVGAVVFRIETGGGSSLAADVILREATLLAETKPLIVSMGSKAASGGYYAAVAGKEIYANKATLTGSIGIFYGKVDLVGLMDKLGVQSESVRSGPRADAESLFRPFTDDERQALGTKVKQFYDLFVGRIAEHRPLTAAQIHGVGEGRVFIGEQALREQLVDRIGGLRQALARARALGGLPRDAELLELPVQQPSLLQLVLEAVGIPAIRTDAPSAGWVPPPLLDIARALVPFMVFEPHRPLALMELSVRAP